ncbi:Alpha/Beta hydrolase protein [Mycena floridula]|nr:Alpha/Beta hydrolase protein [Mycena floridula]
MHSSSFVVGGLPVNVFSTGIESTKPVLILFLLHGRTGSSKDPYITQSVEAMLGRHTGSQRRDLYVVTFDHRNHGHRLVASLGNQGWSKEEGENNERHLIDMYAIETGTAKDLSFLIDFLPAYLFPQGGRTIEEFGVAGISLGGHSTWIALAQEPRITIGIPIIGCPDVLKLMTPRAAQYGISPLVGSKYLPDSLHQVILRSDPASQPYQAKDSTNPFFGKKILVLSGGSDSLVPWDASQSFVEGLQVGSGVLKVVVEEGMGHNCSPLMIQEMASFVYGLNE